MPEPRVKKSKKKEGVRLSLYLDPDFKDEIEAMAHAERKTVSYFIRETLYNRLHPRRKRQTA